MIEGGAPPLTGMRLKNPGDQQTAPAAWSDPGQNASTPDYSLQAMFGTAVASVITIDAHSTGNGVIPRHDGSGAPIITNNWMGVTISIANNGGSTIGSGSGLPGSFWDFEEQVHSDSAGALLVTYYMKQSLGLANGLAGMPIIESSRIDLGLDVDTSHDLSAVDYGVGVVTFDDPPSNVFFSNDVEYYFSVSSAAAGSLPNPFAHDPRVAGAGANVPANGVDVYRITWTPGGAGWSDPEIYVNGLTLGLDPTSELDGLEVDPSNGTIIFSASVDSSFDGSVSGPISQLMIYQTFLGSSATEFSSRALKDKMNNGNTRRVTKRAGLGDNGQANDDEIDGVCTIDPGIKVTRGGSHGFSGEGLPSDFRGVFTAKPDPASIDMAVGFPRAYIGHLGTPFGMSIVRGRWNATGYTDNTLVQVTGLGGLPFGHYQIQLWIRPGDLPAGSSVPADGWQPLGSPLTRTPNDTVTEFVLPDSILPDPTVAPGPYAIMAKIYEGDVLKRSSFASVIKR